MKFYNPIKKVMYSTQQHYILSRYGCKMWTFRTNRNCFVSRSAPPDSDFRAWDIKLNASSRLCANDHQFSSTHYRLCSYQNNQLLSLQQNIGWYNSKTNSLQMRQRCYYFQFLLIYVVRILIAKVHELNSLIHPLLWNKYK